MHGLGNAWLEAARDEELPHVPHLDPAPPRARTRSPVLARPSWLSMTYSTCSLVAQRFGRSRRWSSFVHIVLVALGALRACSRFPGAFATAMYCSCRLNFRSHLESQVGSGCPLHGLLVHCRLSQCFLLLICLMRSSQLLHAPGPRRRSLWPPSQTRSLAVRQPGHPAPRRDSRWKTIGEAALVVQWDGVPQVAAAGGSTTCAIRRGPLARRASRLPTRRLGTGLHLQRRLLPHVGLHLHRVMDLPDFLVALVTVEKPAFPPLL